MLIYEFRVVLPLNVEEYQVGQLWSVAEASKNETGGGEGIEVINNEPFTPEVFPPSPELLGGKYSTGQFTYKKYHLINKVPKIIKTVAPKGLLVLEEHAWNAYPYCRTILTNPAYMKENFHIKIDSLHVQDDGSQENVFNLSKEQLELRKVVYIDIGNDPCMYASDYKAEFDPSIFISEKTSRGPFKGEWQKVPDMPIMCAYKLVTCEFKWFGLQNIVEKIIMNQERRIFSQFHRMTVCWMDKWIDFNMEDIRKIEDTTKEDLEFQIKNDPMRGATEFE